MLTGESSRYTIARWHIDDKGKTVHGLLSNTRGLEPCRRGEQLRRMP
ncbi:hypothetical protein PG5_14050 [Pseudomonas sp. G5(2012)]|nr:hypothetical protein PG5_14050 [Pseudomonas sp. G5(2012)]